jgi:hypothetical protein
MPRTCHIVRVSGAVFSSSCVNVVCDEVVLTSTTGLAPTTVTVSSMPPTGISALTLATNPAVRRRSCLTTERKPVNPNRSS